MNNKKLILALIKLALFVALLCNGVQSQQPKKTEDTAENPDHVTHFEIILVGEGSTPKWSPDGTKLAFSCHEGICVTDSSGKSDVTKIVPLKPMHYEWLNDSGLVVCEWEYGRIEDRKTLAMQIRKASLGGKIETIKETHPSSEDPTPAAFSDFIVLPDGTVGYYEISGVGEGELIFKILREGRLEPERSTKQMMAVGIKGEKGVWLMSADRSIKKRVTEKEYGIVQLSPDGSKLIGYEPVVHEDQLNIVVFDTTGKELANLGKGIIRQDNRITGNWSPDSKKIAYFDTKEKGYEVLASEIYLINADGSGKTQVTNTPDELEFNPVWSPDGTKIACTGHDSGRIYIIRIK